jgi:tetratricopeptide (TPR) repeat protein
MTQAMSYGLANLPERGLAILQRVQSTVDESDADEGEELFYLVLGDLAQKSREFDIAIDALNRALEIKPDFAPALLVLGGVYFDRAQLFPYRTQSVPDGLEGCFSTANIDQSSPTLEAAIADNEEAIRLLQRAMSVAETQYLQFAPRSHLSLGLAYRGRAALWLMQGKLDEAEAAFSEAESELDRALAAFTPADNPVYHAWARVAMGTVARLRAHTAAVRRDQATDADARAAANAETIGWLNTTIEHYDACLALRDRTEGNLLFQQRVLACSCEPFALEARQVLSSTVEANP